MVFEFIEVHFYSYRGTFGVLSVQFSILTVKFLYGEKLIDNIMCVPDHNKRAAIQATPHQVQMLLLF